MDMMNMFGKMKEVQSRMQEAQATLSTISETGEAGAGLVRVTVNGLKNVQKVEIDPDLLKSADDREMLQDLIVAATNKAMNSVESKAKEHIRQATQGLLPNIPGLNLDGLM
ncbi:YbaB/EbfC family nucleoid-associated protein [Spirosoma pomorum]